MIARYMKRRGRDVCWICACSCGTFRVVRGSLLRKGLTQSCGCFHREQMAEVGRSSRTHGESHGFAEYRIWHGMLGRCENPSDKAYPNYGGRGITVCERWHVYENFLADMGRRPSEDHSLDRRENDKGYSPDNCRWATTVEQAENKRSTHTLTFRGETKTLTRWARELGIRATTLLDRLDRGWPVEEAVTRPGDQGKGWKYATTPRGYVRCAVCGRVFKNALNGCPARHAPIDQLNSGNGMRMSCAGHKLAGLPL